MIFVVFAFVMVNLALGFCCAYALAMPLPWEKTPATSTRDDSVKGIRLSSSENASVTETEPTVAEQPSSSSSARPPEVIPELMSVADELPLQWLEQLAAEGIEANSLAEASAHIVRLEVGRYREQLVTAESRALAHFAERNFDALATLAGDLRHINEDWLERQGTAAQMLGQRKPQAAAQEEVASSLEQALLDQGASIKQVNEALASLDYRAEVENGGRQLFEKIAGLVDQAHILRDRIQDLIATLLRSEGRLDSVGSSMQLDRATGLANRVGLEMILHQWRMEDPERKRALSVALVDIDHFARVNERLGTRAGDRTLAAFSQMLANLIRKDRGYDRIARLGGETLFLFYGDTEISNGLIAAERARQTLEATTWDDQGAEFDLTVSCGVINVGRDDTLTDILRRGRAALRFAKQAGRNRVAVDEGEGPQTRPPPEFSLKARVVQIEPDA